MKIKKEYLILASVIVALILYLILGRQDQPGSDLPRMTVLDNAKLNRMVVTNKGVTIELVKKETRWFIMPNNYPVDPFKIKNMVKAAAELTVTALVSESGNYTRYDLDETKRTKVQIYNDEQMQREFDIGRAAPTFEHTFVLLSKDANVYHAKGRLNTTFELTIDGLRDKAVLSFEKEEVASLQIQKGDQELTLAKTETIDDANKEGAQEATAPVTKTQWQSQDGSMAAQLAVNALLSSLSGLKCDAYMADDAKAKLSDATWTVTLKSDSKEYTLSLFASQEKEAAQFPGASSSNDFAFFLSKTQVETIEKQFDKLLNPTP